MKASGVSRAGQENDGTVSQQSSRRYSFLTPVQNHRFYKRHGTVLSALPTILVYRSCRVPKGVPVFSEHVVLLQVINIEILDKMPIRPQVRDDIIYARPDREINNDRAVYSHKH